MHGAPQKLFSDNAKAEMSNKTKAILRNFGITDGSSEPHYQNQNAAEREIQDVKKDAELVMNVTNTPYEWWPLCIEYICMVKNHTARSALQNRTPIEKRTGQTPDVSKLLQFRWYEPVYYLNEHGVEQLGRWAGVAEHVGDELTYIIVSDATGHAMFRSDLRTATDPNSPNFRAETVAADARSAKERKRQSSGDKDTGSNTIFSPYGTEERVDADEKVYPFTPEDLLGKTFMREDPTNGDIIRSEIVRMLKKHSEDTHKGLKFLVETKNGDQTAEEVMDYIELCDIVEAQVKAIEDGTDGGLLTFKSILAHQGPLTVRDPRYKGSAWNLLIEWDDGEPTWEPLKIIASCDPVAVALYGEANNLLNKKGWKYLKKHAKNIRKIYKRVREVLKAKSSQGARFKYGQRLPDREKTYADLDEENGNTKWTEATRAELDLLEHFEAFEDCGEFTPEKAQDLIDKGYQFIKLMMIYDVKPDGRYRARFVAAGNMTRPGGDAYSSVVSFRTMRLAILLGEMNMMKMMVGDITSAYLMALTKELIFFKAGPEFMEKAGHLMIVRKALYGLRSSGKSWHDLLFDTLTDMGFKPSFADPDIWMRDNGRCYEYVCSYVDDLTAIMDEPEAFFDELKRRGFGLKGVTSEPDVFLGGSFGRDPDGTLYWGAKRYIARCIDTYERAIGEKPKTCTTPMPERAQPELDDSAKLDDAGKVKYQALIGCLQWVVTLGRFDIACAVMTMSRFRVEPHEGHLALLGNIFGYLRKYPDGAIRFHTDQQPHEARFTPSSADWERTVYGEPFEDIPDNAPVAKGKAVQQTTYVDANLIHCNVTGRAAMGAVFMAQNTIIGHFSRRQSTVETATYASEFVAARAALDESLAIRYEIRMLGAPIEGPIWLFGDNKSMIDSASQPSGRLQKRHLILSWHRLREKAAMGIVYYLHIGSKENIADCLTKHLTHVPLWNLIKDQLFYRYNSNNNNDVVEILHVDTTNAAAPNGEYHGENNLGSEPIVILDDTWIPILLDGPNLPVHQDESMTVP
jgi:Reverse transcriptase (RNA-dependent DNA polymerase)